MRLPLERVRVLNNINDVNRPCEYFPNCFIELREATVYPSHLSYAVCVNIYVEHILKVIKYMLYDEAVCAFNWCLSS